MIHIEPHGADDVPRLIGFVSAIQEYERRFVSGLKRGSEIADDYAATIIKNVRERNGAILMARQDGKTVGFACAWIAIDEDPLIRDDTRRHAYVSDIYVDEHVRKGGIATSLLTAIERTMRDRGCSRIRICSKAANEAAMKCYESAGYQPYEVDFVKALD